MISYFFSYLIGVNVDYDVAIGNAFRLAESLLEEGFPQPEVIEKLRFGSGSITRPSASYRRWFRPGLRGGGSGRSFRRHRMPGIKAGCQQAAEDQHDRQQGEKDHPLVDRGDRRDGRTDSSAAEEQGLRFWLRGGWPAGAAGERFAVASPWWRRQAASGQLPGGIRAGMFFAGGTGTGATGIETDCPATTGTEQLWISWPSFLKLNW